MKFDLTAKRFNDEDAAREYLESIRWPNGPVCPHCGCIGRASRLEGESHRKGLLFCGDCRKQFSVTVGTVFERSKIKLNKWILAAHLMCASKKAMSAHQIHRMLGITYKSAWFMCHRLREAMSGHGPGLLGSNGGTVEVDETFWGNKKPKGSKGRGYEHKMKIVSLVDRDGEKRSFHVPRVTAATLRPILEQHICQTATINTDEFRAYKTLAPLFNKHEIVTHSKGEYARGKAYTNTVECSFSLLKRGLIGTFHHVGEQHLQRYVTEFDFRWNNRIALGVDDVARAETLLGQVGGKRLTYATSDR